MIPPDSGLFTSVQLLSHVRLFVTPWTAACQASLSITNSRSLPKLISIELVMPSNHLMIFRPLLMPSIFPSIGVFSNESVLHIRWPKCWIFSFSISPFSDYSELISFRIDWFDLLNFPITQLCVFTPPLRNCVLIEPYSDSVKITMKSLNQWTACDIQKIKRTLH